MGPFHFFAENYGQVAAAGLAVLAYYPPKEPPNEAASLIGKRLHAVAICVFLAATFLAYRDDKNEIRARDERLGQMQLSLAAVSTQADIKRTLDLITGGDAYPTVAPMFNQGYLHVAIENHGNYGIYDGSVEITDKERVSQEEALAQQRGEVYDPEKHSFGGSIVSRGLPNLRARGGRFVLYRVKRVAGNRKEMNIEFGFDARNGPSAKHLKIVPADGGYSITRTGTGIAAPEEFLVETK